MKNYSNASLTIGKSRAQSKTLFCKSNFWKIKELANSIRNITNPNSTILLAIDCTQLMHTSLKQQSKNST